MLLEQVQTPATVPAPTPVTQVATTEVPHVPNLANLGQYAGAVGFASFAGVFLAGILLSMFWKNFGPWQQLKEAKDALRTCEAHRAADMLERMRDRAELAQMKSEHNMILKALETAGLTLGVSPTIHE